MNTITFNDHQATVGQSKLVADDPVVQFVLEKTGLRRSCLDKADEQVMAIIQALDTALEGRQDFSMPLEPAYCKYILSYQASAGNQGEILGTTPPQPRKAGPPPAGKDRQQTLYLYNVIVALEWQPDEENLRQLKWAFRRASDHLYDATDGLMAFGQVLFGDASWMDYADIQIMASNRIMPRSWVAGQVNPEKYMPIRIGRGVWSKDRRRCISLDEPEGYRALVHEWAHYALCQRDDYLVTVQVRPGQQKHALEAATAVAVPAQDGEGLQAPPLLVVVPTVRGDSDSIMATPQGTSELPLELELDIISDENKKKLDWYGDVEQKATQSRARGRLRPRNAGPGALPLPLPVLGTLPPFGPTNGGESIENSKPMPEIWIEAPPDLVPHRCEVYVVKGKLDAPTQIIAQGTFEGYAEEPNGPYHEEENNQLARGKRPRAPLCLRLLGAALEDTIVMMGPNKQGQTVIHNGMLEADAKQTAELGVPIFRLREQTTRSPGARKLPALAVIPEQTDNVTQRSVGTTIRRDGQTPEEERLDTYTYPLGKPKQQRDDKNHTQLDGYLFAYDPQTGSPLIAPYSLGGNPRTVVAVIHNPISGGSSDGEALLFFRLRSQPSEDTFKGYAAIRIVTTVLPDLSDTKTPPDGVPAGRVFCIASNKQLPMDDKLDSSLLIFFDPAEEDDRHYLAICRLDRNNTWMPLRTYVPASSPFAATTLREADHGGRLTEETVPDKERVEYYRLFRFPRQPS